MEEAQTTFQERISELTIEHIVADVSVTQFLEDLVEVAQTIFVPQVVGRIFDPVQQRTAQQIVDVPAPQVVEESAEVIQIISQRGITVRVAKQIFDEVVEVPQPQK